MTVVQSYGKSKFRYLIVGLQKKTESINIKINQTFVFVDIKYNQRLEVQYLTL